MKAIYKKRLLKVARALRESPKPRLFTMERYGHTACGAPACALGHYAARRDLQKTFTLEKLASHLGPRRQMFPHDKHGSPVSYDNCAVLDHFGLTGREAEELFSEEGCGGAKRPVTAAKYIERFVAKQS